MVSERRRTGADRWNEMRGGVLHIPPLTSRPHQDFCSALETWLRDRWARPHGNRVHREVNLASIGGWLVRQPCHRRSPEAQTGA
jgi:hypothetical protein